MIGRFKRKIYFNFRRIVELELFLTVADVVLGCGGDVVENGN